MHIHEIQKNDMMNLFAEQEERHRHREQTCWYTEEEGEGGKNWESGIDMYTTMYKIVGSNCLVQGTRLKALWWPREVG